MLRRLIIKPQKGRSKKEDAGYRVNREIRATEIRLIDDEGKMVGVMAPQQALSMAQDRGLDLIEIAPNAKPPTCRIMDYGKWKYENKKKQTAARKNQTIISIKEIQVRPRTEQHDLETKLKHARRFLLDGDKVKVNLRFMGREMAHQDLGVDLLNKFTTSLQDIAIIEQEPKREGRQMFVLMAPDAVKIKELEKEKSRQSQASPVPLEEVSSTES